MIENLYGTFTFGLLITSISIIVFLLIFNFILWPILKIILTPVIGGWLKIYELYKKRRELKKIQKVKIKEDQSVKQSVTEKIEIFFGKFENSFYAFLNKIALWFSKNFIIKILFLILTPFFIINYVLEAIELNKNILSIDNELINNTIWAMFGAILVSLLLSILLKIMNFNFKKNMPLSFLVICTIGIIHYFL